jgi:hypothetical protein
MANRLLSLEIILIDCLYTARGITVSTLIISRQNFLLSSPNFYQ